ncbi:MAG: OmpH family outer membrane protein [Deltaproteobacteria bacterium]|nr:OmpH family outer membrane protein [Deltaproteobacteria bacterium]
MKLSSILVTGLVLLSSAVAQADYRVATVDVNRILNETKEAKTKKKELDDITLKAKAKIEEKRKVLKATEDKLKAASVSPESKEAEKFRTDAREFARFVKDTDEDIKKQFMVTNKALTDKALDIVKKYAEQHNIDLVLDKGEKGRGPVLFGDDSADITDDIIKSLN